MRLMRFAAAVLAVFLAVVLADPRPAVALPCHGDEEVAGEAEHGDAPLRDGAGFSDGDRIAWHASPRAACAADASCRGCDAACAAACMRGATAPALLPAVLSILSCRDMRAPALSNSCAHRASWPPEPPPPRRA